MMVCHPFDERSNPKADAPISMMLDIDLLLQKKTFEEVKTIAENGPVYSIPGVIFMSALSGINGNVLHIIPGQGYKYYEKPEYVVLTNFSPFKGNSENRQWNKIEMKEKFPSFGLNTKKLLPSKYRFWDWGAFICSVMCILIHYAVGVTPDALIDMAVNLFLIYGMLIVRKETGNAWGCIFIFFVYWNAF